MADPLSIASAIAGLLALSGTILSSGYKYVHDVKDAPQELRQLLRDTAALDALLDQLRALTSREGAVRSTFNVLANGSAIDDCRELLGSLHRLMEECEQVPGQKKRNFVKSLVWPLKESGTQKLLVRLGQLIDTFTAALTVDAALSLQRIEHHTSAIVQDVRELQISNDHHEILNWICPVRVNVEENLETALKLREPGTGKWLLELPSFEEWSNFGTNSLLWISGIPGSGKTVLAAMIVEHLRALKLSADVGLCYFFCDHQLQNFDKQSLRTFSYTIIRQLLGQNSSCMDDVETTYKRLHSDSNASISLTDLKLVLKSLLGRFKRVFIVLDALDECEEIEEFTEEFTDLLECELQDTDVRLLVTSRCELAIERALLCRWHINLDDQRDLVVDIWKYIAQQVENRIVSGKLKLRNRELKTEIISRLGDRAKNMFLWAKIQLDQLSLLRSDKAIKNALDHLPRGLDETYVRILQKIQLENIDSIEDVKAMLRWLVGSTAPLTMHEIAEVIAIVPQDTCRNLDAIATDPRDILSFCGSLVVSESNPKKSHSPTVSLAHLSVREYLTSSRILDTPVATFHMDVTDVAARLAETCVQYLGFTDFKNPCFTPHDMVSRLRSYPFLQSASLQWYAHIRESGASRPSKSPIKRLGWFFDANVAHENYFSWRQVLDYATFQDIGIENAIFQDISNPSPMYYAALFGLEEVCQHLLRTGIDVNGSVNASKFPPTALHIASVAGYANVVKLLIDKGASLDVRASQKGLTPLDMAAEAGREGAVEALLAAGASVHSTSHSGATAFYRAARSGSTKVVEMLHAAGSDINVKTWSRWTALHEAIELNHEDVFDQLLSWNVDLHVRNRHGHRALEAAVFYRRRNMFHKLTRKMEQEGIVTGSNLLTESEKRYPGTSNEAVDEPLFKVKNPWQIGRSRTTSF